MNALTIIVMLAPAPARVADSGSLLVWIAVPAAILGAVVAGLIKRAVLSRPKYRDHRPGIRTFAWVAIADLVAWGVLWPSLLAVRLQGGPSNRGLWILALLMVVALGYIANRYGFGKALRPSIAGSIRGTLLAEFFTVLMPVLGVVFGLVIWVVVGSGR